MTVRLAAADHAICTGVTRIADVETRTVATRSVADAETHSGETRTVAILTAATVATRSAVIPIAVARSAAIRSAAIRSAVILIAVTRTAAIRIVAAMIVPGIATTARVTLAAKALMRLTGAAVPAPRRANVRKVLALAMTAGDMTVAHVSARRLRRRSGTPTSATTCPRAMTTSKVQLLECSHAAIIHRPDDISQEVADYRRQMPGNHHALGECLG